jgi:hypothetical protein
MTFFIGPYRFSEGYQLVLQTHAKRWKLNRTTNAANRSNDQRTVRQSFAPSKKLWLRRGGLPSRYRGKLISLK